MQTYVQQITNAGFERSFLDDLQHLLRRNQIGGLAGQKKGGDIDDRYANPRRALLSLINSTVSGSVRANEMHARSPAPSVWKTAF